MSDPTEADWAEAQKITQGIGPGVFDQDGGGFEISNAIAHALAARYAAGLAEGRRQMREVTTAIAKKAPGQDWSDDTTPQEMAKFIEEAIAALPDHRD